jgi:hypothetical protein
VSEWFWTAVLVGLACATLWYSVKHWWGWIIGAGSEFAWVYYSLYVVKSLPLLIMSGIYLVLYVRATLVAWRKEHSDNE